MFNVMEFLTSNVDRLSDQARAEVEKVKQEHDKQLCQKGYSDHVRKETPT